MRKTCPTDHLPLRLPPSVVLSFSPPCTVYSSLFLLLVDFFFLFFISSRTSAEFYPRRRRRRRRGPRDDDDDELDDARTRGGWTHWELRGGSKTRTPRDASTARRAAFGGSCAARKERERERNARVRARKRQQLCEEKGEREISGLRDRARAPNDGEKKEIRARA